MSGINPVLANLIHNKFSVVFLPPLPSTSRPFSIKIFIDSQALSSKEEVGMTSELDNKVALIQKFLLNTQLCT